MRALLYRFGLYFAWVAAMTGTLGSLTFSEVLFMEPCKLCWLQRIFLFPLAIQLGIATYRKDHGIVRYTLPLCVLGSLIAGFQILEQHLPEIAPIDLCGAGPNCGDDPLMLFGFISIAQLALAGFLVIAFFLWCARPRSPAVDTPSHH